jgi:UDP-glucose 4-epimerase/UDP-glucuronate decarboxylase
VTGAAGLIGHELVAQLLARGDEVVALDRYLKGGRDDLAALDAAHPGRLTVLERDLAAAGAVRDLGRFDGVYHMAAIVGVRYVEDHPYETLSVNLRSTLEVADLAVASGCRALVVASSSENYAAGVERGWVPIPTPEDVPLVLDDPALPRWSYAASKIATESAAFAAARLADFAPVVLRFHKVYGERMGPTHVIPEFVERALAGVDPFPIRGADQTRSFMHVEDAGRGVLLVADAALADPARGAGVWHVGCSQETRIGDLAELVFEAVGVQPRVLDLPAPAGSVSRRVPDARKLEALGFEARVALADGVRRCVAARRGAPA